MWDIFWGVLKFQMFLGSLKFLIFFGGERKKLGPSLRMKKKWLTLIALFPFFYFFYFGAVYDQNLRCF